MTITIAQLDAHWMPFTGNRQFKKDPRMMVAAEGRYYIDSNGRKFLMVCRGFGPAAWDTK